VKWKKWSVKKMEKTWAATGLYIHQETAGNRHTEVHESSRRGFDFLFRMDKALSHGGETFNERG
jgi:hypothetical protein